jgi:hypothetical protein
MIFKFEVNTDAVVKATIIVTTVVAIATISIQARNIPLGLTGLITVTGIAYIALENGKPKRE